VKNLARAREIFRGLEKPERDPNGLAVGLAILGQYTDKIVNRREDGQTFACKLDDIENMRESDIKRLFVLGWRFDHYMEWWVFPDK